MLIIHLKVRSCLLKKLVKHSNKPSKLQFAIVVLRTIDLKVKAMLFTCYKPKEIVTENTAQQIVNGDANST
jgi:hypothetical protein